MPQQSKVEILNIDCLEYMATLPDKAFELAIVDPPYGIGQDWKKSNNRKVPHAETSYKNHSIPDQAYFDQLIRVTKNQVVWGYNYYAHMLPISNNLIVWDKVLTFETGLKSEGELAWTSIKKYPLRIYKHQWDGAKKGTENGKIITIHPHQKPVHLYRWVLKMYASPGDRILDTHLGSGSSAIAAHQMDFDFVGTELDKDYYDAAVKRFNNAKLQTKLF